MLVGGTVVEHVCGVVITKSHKTSLGKRLSTATASMLQPRDFRKLCRVVPFPPIFEFNFWR